MWAQPSICRKYHFAVRIEESFDRIRNELVYHEDFIAVCQREEATIDIQWILRERAMPFRIESGPL